MIINMNMDLKSIKENSVLLFLAVMASAIYLQFPWLGQAKLVGIDVGTWAGAVIELGFLSFIAGVLVWVSLIALDLLDSLSRDGGKYVTGFLFTGSLAVCICYVYLNSKGKTELVIPPWLYGYAAYMFMILNAKSRKPAKTKVSASVG